MEYGIPVSDFLSWHEDVSSGMHPLNVIDAQARSFPAVANLFVLPQVARDVSLGHKYMKDYPLLRTNNIADFTTDTEHYLLVSEAGSVTVWHQDYTGSAVRYEVVHGRKIFLMVPPTFHNITKFHEWEEKSDEYKRYVLND